MEKKKNVTVITRTTKIASRCGKRFLKTFSDDKNYCKVRDHCHYTGKYKGAVHTKCSLRFNVPPEIPLVIYNRSYYDHKRIS